VDLDEPLAVTADGRWLVFTAADGRLLATRLYDAGEDGLVDSLGAAARLLRGPGYGATIAMDDRIAFTFDPSDADPSLLLAAVLEDGALGASHIPARTAL
jgi:hypothetical protein